MTIVDDPTRTPPNPGPVRRRLAERILAGVVAAGITFGVPAGISALNDPTPTGVQPVSFAGSDPFTPPIGRDDPDVAALDLEGPAAASTPGLYADGTGACVGEQLIEHLAADPVRSAEWASVFGIAGPEIPAFVRSLTPALLRADTAVTDHGFRDGRFVEAQAVLARGTAVLVSPYGQPTVKCLNGNPLTPPMGPVASGATVVAPSATVLTTITFSTPGGDLTPERPTPDPVGPTPEQIAAAQQARADADAAARAAMEAHEEATKAVVIASAARTQADRAHQEFVDAQQAADQARLALEIAKDKVKDLAKTVEDLTPARNPIESAILNSVRDQLEAARQIQQEAEGVVEEVEGDRDAAFDRAVASEQEAQDREAEASRAGTDAGAAADEAERLDGIADEAEEEAGIENRSSDQGGQSTDAGTGEPVDTAAIAPGTPTDPAADDPATADAPVTDDEPVVEEPAVEEPAVEEPAVEDPAVEEPATGGEADGGDGGNAGGESAPDGADQDSGGETATADQ